MRFWDSSNAFRRSVELASGTQVAIKRVSFRDETVARSVYREIHILSHLSHPCILTLYDLYAVQDMLYMVTKLSVSTLHQLITKNFALLTVVNIVPILYQLTAGIHVPAAFCLSCRADPPLFDASRVSTCIRPASSIETSSRRMCL